MLLQPKFVKTVHRSFVFVIVLKPKLRMIIIHLLVLLISQNQLIMGTVCLFVPHKRGNRPHMLIKLMM